MDRCMPILSVWMLLACSLIAEGLPDGRTLTAVRWNRVLSLVDRASAQIGTVETASSVKPNDWKADPAYVPSMERLIARKNKESAPVLIVGDDPVDETLVLTADQWISGDILVMNQGSLAVEGCTIRLDGSVILAHDGLFRVTDATLAFQSTYLYQHGISGGEDTLVQLDHAVITSNGYNLESGFADNAQFQITDTESESVMTTALFGAASATMVRSNLLEWVLDENSHLSISDDDGPFIFWPIFPDGSVADLTFPDGEHVASFEISPDDPDITGLSLSLNLENVSHVWWGLMLRSGADVTVRDSVMRTTGFIMDQGETVTITGLVNGQTYADMEIPVEGARYHLVNTRVDTWNVYGWGAQNLEMANCLFGELGVLDRTDATLTNCLIDGTGGYLFTGSDTQTLVMLSSLTSATVANDHSTQVFALSSILNGDIVATNQSVILLLNTITERIPQARDAALAVEMNIAPPPAPAVEDILPIEGTAFVASGPELGVSLDHWQLFYGPGDGSSGWFPITGEESRMLRSGTLAGWDTRGLTPGPYTLRLSLTLAGGFSVDTTRYINLGAESPDPATIACIPHVDWSAQWQTYLTADNTGTSPSEINWYLYEDGQLVRSETATVPAGDQLEIPLVEGTCGWAVGGSQIRFRETFVHNTENGMAEFLLDDAGSETLHLLLPRYAAEHLTWTGIALMNPSGNPATGTLDAIGPDGSLINETTLDIPANTRVAGLLETYFAGVDRSGVARIEVRVDQPVTGLVIAGNGNEQLLFTRGVAGEGLERQVLPHVADQWQTWENRLILDNLSDQPVTIGLQLFSAGLPVVDEDLDVDAGGQRVINLNDWADLEPRMGVLTGTGEAVVARLSYRAVSEGGMAEFVLHGAETDELQFLFPGGFTDSLDWMGMAVANGGSAPVEATLTAWQNGIPVAFQPVEIPGYSRLADVIPGFLPTLGELGADRIAISASLPVLSGLTISGFGQERLLFTPAVP